MEPPGWSEQGQRMGGWVEAKVALDMMGRKDPWRGQFWGDLENGVICQKVQETLRMGQYETQSPT